MGVTYVDVTVRPFGRTNGSGYRGEFLVDTGSIDCVVPASQLVRVGIEPVDTQVYELADGAEQEFRVGGAEIEVLGVRTYGRVIFGPEGTEPILGVTIMEQAGMIIDPATNSVTRRRAIPLK
jgi:clan AA aspartic protease